MKSRWFVKYQTGLRPSYCVQHCHDEAFRWSRELGRHCIIYHHKIPKEFWDLPINAYINYFEHGTKPRIRV